MADMPEYTTKIYVAFEPEHERIAQRLDSWTHTNADHTAYNSRVRSGVDVPAAEPMKTALRMQILDADVVVCIVGQTTFLDEWIDWEIKTARSKPGRAGFVAVMLDDLYAHPPALKGAGTMFIKMKQTFVIDAIQWAGEQEDPTEDFILEE